MTTINNFIKQLSRDIKNYYINTSSKCEDEWILVCETAMKNFVLSRNGWKKDEKSNNVFVYLKKYPITISIINSKSPGQLLIDTATEIAKAELLEKMSDKNSSDDLIKNIVVCIKKQDWIIPFVRTKMS